jgi:polyhydroxybutyrate depolymerase
MSSLVILTTVLAFADSTLAAGDHTRTLEVDGRTRSYLVHVPPSYDGKTTYPVVLAFHGAATNGQIMARFCGLSEKADSAGFIVVYPNGTGRNEKLLTFNAGNCCAYAALHNIDDVKFTRILLGDLKQSVRVDPKRIFVTGMSNGGMMAYRLASESSEIIAAAAPVGGPMATQTCAPRRSVPIIHFHGTEDEFAPYAGGRGPQSTAFAPFYSVQHSVDAWVRANGCSDKPTVEKLPNKADDGMTVTRKTWGSGREGSEVVLVTIEGGGHSWPGRDPRLEFLGPSTKDISANDLMWEFFQKHARK